MTNPSPEIIEKVENAIRAVFVDGQEGLLECCRSAARIAIQAYEEAKAEGQTHKPKHSGDDTQDGGWKCNCGASGSNGMDGWLLHLDSADRVIGNILPPDNTENPQANQDDKAFWRQLRNACGR